MADDLDNSSVGFLYKTMLSRDPSKRRVKPVAHEQLLINFAGLGDSSDDSDFEIGKKKKGSKKGESSSDDEDDDDDDDDDISDDEDDNEEEDDGSEGSENDSDNDENEKKDGELTSDNLQSLSVADFLTQTKDKLLQCESKAPSEDTLLSSVSSKKPIKVSVCCVCLGGNSDTADEIVDCDGCGVSVHEGCYGITDSQSISSTASSASTEPWFCDACKAGKKPNCELCPNTGGIFKETDACKWVHLTCALYIPGVAFGNVDSLSPVTLFEMSYSKWGAKECILCEDARFSRTGVCIGCDAGMCRNYFHVSCAQREGLLSEASPDEDIADPFYAYCKQHAEKSAVRTKRRNWLAVQSHIRQFREKINDVLDEKDKIRVQRKLNGHRRSYLEKKTLRPPSWVPPVKLPRLLSSCPSALRRLLHKAELLGVSAAAHPSAAMATAATAVTDVRKKWHIQPAMSVEFVSYYFDRESRMVSMRNHTRDLIAQKEVLQSQERVIRSKYEKLTSEVERLDESAIKLREEGDKLFKILTFLGKKAVKKPQIFMTPRKSPKEVTAVSKIPSEKPTKSSTSNSIIHQCGICHKTNDQHLLAHCDECKLHYHLGCLNPPLTRMPKKTRLYGWQCSECISSSSDDDPEHAGDHIDKDAPRKLRETIKEPKKFMPPLLTERKKHRKIHVDRKRSKKSIKCKQETTPSSSKEKSRKDTKVIRKSIDVEVIEDDDSETTPPAKQRKSTARKSTTPRVAKPKDPMTECAMCNIQADSTQLVRCDECRLSYHFHCLQPPQTKSPKVRGYTWLCMACNSESESEEDESRNVPEQIVILDNSDDDEIHSNVSHSMPVEMLLQDLEENIENIDNKSVGNYNTSPQQRRKRQKTAKMKAFLGEDNSENGSSNDESGFTGKNKCKRKPTPKKPKVERKSTSPKSKKTHTNINGMDSVTIRGVENKNQVKRTPNKNGSQGHVEIDSGSLECDEPMLIDSSSNSS